MSKEKFVELSEDWLRAVSSHDPDRVVRLYAPDGVLVGTVAQRIKIGRAEIVLYFNRFLKKDGLLGKFDSHIVQDYGAWGVHSGTYTFAWREGGKPVLVPARFTFVWRQTSKGWLIANHHSSALPE